MPSLRARIVKRYLKSIMKSKPLHLMPPKALTAGAEKIGPKRPPRGVSMQKVQKCAVKGEWRRADGAGAGPTILYFHGGGYYYGSPVSHRGLTFVSDDEVLLYDSTRLHRGLQYARVESNLIIEHGLAHVWPIFHPRFPETGKIIEQSAEFNRAIMLKGATSDA